MQIHQAIAGRIEVRLIPAEGFQAAEVEAEITAAIRKATGDALQVSFAYPTAIPPTSSGKHRFLLQDLGVDGH
ncbi:hypothetical protein D3C87_1789520 [compost metagenome]